MRAYHHSTPKMNLNKSLKILLSTLLMVGTVMAAPSPAPPSGVYKLCIPEIYLDECNKMVTEMNANNVHVSCVVGRDRLECLHKIQSHEADFGPVDPEDLYIASRIPYQDFNLFKDIRTKEEPAEVFRYEAVAVIRKNLEISNIQGLKGLKSCHTGINRNVGYKIPLTKLTKMGTLSIANDPNLTTQESELKALSHFFGKACLVGKWSKDAVLNQRLKSTYSNLCELCENPAVCDYPDKYSGYDGALRCLSENGGDVAWTKVYYVKKHFGLGGREATSINPDEYAYLCPDGSKAPMTAKPGKCTWAARPWQGYITTGQMASSVPALRNVIAQANTVGEKTNADWLKILALDNKTVAVDNIQPQSPQGYLDKAGYTDVIERNWGSASPVRICVTSDDELNKCRDLARAAWSRDVRPGFNCVLQESVQDCLRTIKDNSADVMNIKPDAVINAQNDFDLKPILAERYYDSEKTFSVAVVKKDSSYQSLADLRGAKSCHCEYESTAGWSVPLYSLVSKSLSTCPHAVSKFFSGGSCAPGALLPDNNPRQDNHAVLCSICAGDLNEADAVKQQATKCTPNVSESFWGPAGAFRCLATAKGDVAFLRHQTVLENTDGKNQEPWAGSLRSSDYELLCPDGGRASIDQYERCNFMEIFPQMMVTRKSSLDHEVNSIRHGLLAATDLYARRPELFKLFGKYNGKSDLLFKDDTKGLLAIDGISPNLQKFIEMQKVASNCEDVTASA